MKSYLRRQGYLKVNGLVSREDMVLIERWRFIKDDLLSTASLYA